MTIQNRTTTITGVFAKNASTTIPTTPVAGTSYRKTSLTKATAEKGWGFKTVVDSSEFNQMIYEYALLTSLAEKYGIITWSNLTDYEAGSLCMGSDGKVYQAKQASGPSSSYHDPTSDSANTYWEIFGTSGFVTLGTTQTITGNKTFSGSVSLGSSATATTPSATDSSTKVATTAWVNNWVSANGGFSTFSKSQNGYVKLGNGIIIQWGRNTVTSSGGQTITLPTAFTSSNYKVISADESSDGYGQLGITARATTNFTFNPNWPRTYAWIAIGY